jgi:hypothetical protein
MEAATRNHFYDAVWLKIIGAKNKVVKFDQGDAS